MTRPTVAYVTAGGAGMFCGSCLRDNTPVQPEHGAFPELLASTGGGRLVPPEDAEALASALHALLVDRDERWRLGEEGRRRVVERFGAKEMALRTWEVYQRVL